MKRSLLKSQYLLAVFYFFLCLTIHTVSQEDEFDISDQAG